MIMHAHYTQNSFINSLTGRNSLMKRKVCEMSIIRESERENSIQERIIIFKLDLFMYGSKSRCGELLLLNNAMT